MYIVKHVSILYKFHCTYRQYSVSILSGYRISCENAFIDLSIYIQPSLANDTAKKKLLHNKYINSIRIPKIGR